MPLSPCRPARRRRAAEWALAALLAPGCSPSSSRPLPPVAPAAPRPECVVGGWTDARRASITVAASDSGDSALVTRQRLLPPVLFDCAGEARPGAARAWSGDSSGRAWTLVLGEAAPEVAAVVTAWRDPTAALTLRLAGVRSLVPLDRRRLVVELDRRFDSVPPVLADPALALPLDVTAPALILAPQVTGDPRDALDAGADLIRTADPGVLAYARADSGRAVAPLPWSRTYVLLLPAGGALGLGLQGDSARFRAELARDAVPGEARAAEPPFWWEARDLCPQAAATRAERSAPAAVIGYRQGDPAAAALAARLVALSDEPGLTARGYSSADIRAALATGGPRGFVLAVPRRALVPCRETRAWPAGATVVPLVETRASAVVRRGLPPLAVEWDGTLRPMATP